MELSEKLLKMLNDQVRMELESAYKYEGMRLYFKDLGIPGSEHWMSLQVEEEREHAEDFIDFILDVDGELAPIGKLEEQPVEYESILDVFEKGLEHEKEISKSIREILDVAMEEGHYAAQNFLRTYIDEQVEEEDHFREQIEMIKMAGDNSAALFQVDHILGKRGE